jgi:serine/threonine-protein kinase
MYLRVDRTESPRPSPSPSPPPPVAAVVPDAAVPAPPPPEQPAIEMPPQRQKPAAPPKPGLLSIDSTPWATIYLDGSSLGMTPIVKRSVPAGRHKLRAVMKDGRTIERTVDIPAGKLAPPIRLTP